MKRTNWARLTACLLLVPSLVLAAGQKSGRLGVGGPVVAPISANLAPAGSTPGAPISALPGASISAPAPSGSLPQGSRIGQASIVPAAPNAPLAAAPAASEPAALPGSALPSAVSLAGPTGGEASASPDALSFSGQEIFDGSAPLGSTDDPVAGASRPYRPDQARASTRQLYTQANPGSRAPRDIEDDGFEFAQTALDIALHHTFDPQYMRHLEEGLARVVGGKQKLATAKEIIGTIERAESDPKAAAFVDSIARRFASERMEMHAMLRRQRSIYPYLDEQKPPYRLASNPLGQGAYWDMASGPNVGDFILNGLEPRTQYTFFDDSLFVVYYLKHVAQRAREAGINVDNVKIVKTDIRRLPKPREPLAVLRAKNVTLYVPGFEADLERMTDWIAEGGMLLIQNDPGFPQRMTIMNDLGPMAKRLIAAGWTFGYDFRNGDDAVDPHLDSLTFTRPRAGEPSRPGRSWASYIEAARQQP